MARTTTVEQHGAQHGGSSGVATQMRQGHPHRDGVVWCLQYSLSILAGDSGQTGSHHGLNRDALCEELSVSVSSHLQQRRKQIHHRRR
eukprot:CAMPEP_0175810552 /NCGR_PEP_ID=MMETSP0107_2-20121207/3387_1 /TAXON_ID=195067 ORGANISM="Goniomonas pacifica, Strain CCMP1869" /NCGR_SAMPLE_ID=MMETSP0107_2 /ASSEMBLY_ACC=CAM_ASM_000203 /LENGTH=87 /DNA_ID=CAMNT_0017122321 /DNA_START=217 /DNA_END=480 /DNA_ORIENTATION=+